MQYINDYLKPSEVWFKDLRDELDQAFSNSQFFISEWDPRFKSRGTIDNYFFTPVEREEGLRFYLAQGFLVERWNHHNLLGFHYKEGDVSMGLESIWDKYDQEIAEQVVKFLKKDGYSDAIEGLDGLYEGVKINDPIDDELGIRIRDAQRRMMEYPYWIRENSYFQGGTGRDYE